MKTFKVDEVYSKSGRKLSKAPKIDTSTGRRITSTIKRLNEWLLKEAKEEMKDCDYSTCLLNSVNLKNISKSDIDMINLFLFDLKEVYIEY